MLLERVAGCAVVIGHDRSFLDRVATHLLVFEGDSHLRWSFEEYERWRHETLGDDSSPGWRATRESFRFIF
jgi:ATPase subunit of ABC transporter with duplicated ATPase domains